MAVRIRRYRAFPIRMNFCERMTMTGSKVEGWEDWGADIKKRRRGRVLTLERHPTPIICGYVR